MTALRVKSWEVVFLPFGKTGCMTMSGTVASPVLSLTHAATSAVLSSASMTLAVIMVFVCSRLVTDI